MKNMKKFLLTMIAMLTLVFAVQVSAGAADVTFKGCTDTSLTVSWVKPTISSDKTFVRYQLEDKNDNVIGLVSDSNQLSYTINGLKKGIHETIWVYYVYTTSYGGPYKSYIGYTDAFTTPANTDLKDLYTGAKNTELHAAGYLPEKATGLQFEFKDLATGKTTRSEKDFSAYATKKVSGNNGYTVRVRSYVKCSTDASKKAYGSWSKAYPFAVASYTGKSTNKSSGFTITLKKGKKIKQYVIYTSAKRDSGYKKAATVKVTGKTKTIRITKAGGKKIPARKTCYIKVVPYVMVGSKPQKSIMYSTASVYIYK